MIKRFDLFVKGITICYKYIQRIKSLEMTELGLKGTHVMCLFYLYSNDGGLTSSELCSLCEEDKAAISRTINDLISKGHIFFDESDNNKKKYRTKLFLTESGLTLAHKINDLISQWVEAGGEGLSEEERSNFYYALGVISENLKNRTTVIKR